MTDVISLTNNWENAITLPKSTKKTNINKSFYTIFHFIQKRITNVMVRTGNRICVLQLYESNNLVKSFSVIRKRKVCIFSSSFGLITRHKHMRRQQERQIVNVDIRIVFGTSVSFQTLCILDIASSKTCYALFIVWICEYKD